MRRIRTHRTTHRPTRIPSHRQRRPSAGDVVAQGEERRGAALVVVGALLGLLALLGFFFYTFAKQENASAEYFSETAKEFQDAGIDPDIFFNWSLNQLIIGGPAHLENSALFGGRHALVPNMFGRDRQPFSGRGVHLINDGAGQPLVDQDFDNTADSAELAYDGLVDRGELFLQFNDSPAAHGRFPSYLGEDAFGPDGGPGVFGVDDDGINGIDDPGEYRHPGPDGQPGVAGVDDDGNGVIDDESEFGTADDSDDFNGTLDAGEDINGNLFLDPAYPSPDVDYTAPDINNMYLAFKTTIPGTAPAQPVMIPSFHRPQYLRLAGVPIADWYINAAVPTRTMRPHPLHAYIPDNGPDGLPGVAGVDDDNNGTIDDPSEFGFPLSDDGQSYATPMRRFLINDPAYPAETAADAAIIDQLPLGSGAFSFQPLDNLGATTLGEMGVWTLSAPDVYNLDADADGDGIYEAIWMDLDFPIQELPGGAGRFIPLFAHTIIDGDALFNMNAHGNADGVVNTDTPAVPFGNGGFISQSNMGVSPSEVNPQWALTASTADFTSTDALGVDGQPGFALADDDGDTVVDGISELGWPGSDDLLAMQQHRFFFDPTDQRALPVPNTLGADLLPGVALVDDDGDTIVDNSTELGWLGSDDIPVFTLDPNNPSPRELSNMEFFMSLVGRRDHQSALVINELLSGRYGEIGAMINALNSVDPTLFPGAGQTGVDDNDNLDLGEAVGGTPAFRHPIDYRGLGEQFDFVNGTQDGKLPLFYTLADTLNRWVQYRGFETRDAPAGTGALWGQPTVVMSGSAQAVADGTGNLMQTLAGVPLLPGFATDALMDEAFEIWVNSTGDDLFDASENAYLQASIGDIANSGLSSRLADLMPVNVANDEIRQMLTTASWDVKPFPRTFYGDHPAGNALPNDPPNLNPWEYTSADDNNDTTPNRNSFGEDVLRFPPVVVPTAANAAVRPDPIRPELAGLLLMMSRLDDAPAALRQRLMSVNHVLDFEFTSTAAATNPMGGDGGAGEFGVDDDSDGFPDFMVGEDAAPGVAGVDDDSDGNVDWLDPPTNTVPDTDELGWLGSDDIHDWKEYGTPGTDDLSPFRPLTEHPGDPGVLTAIGLPALPHPGVDSAFATLVEQEGWARLDRQRMARDIYVMLYLFCGGETDDGLGNSINYRTTDNTQAGTPLVDATGPLYNGRELIEMAQFAINVVNSLDRDIVIDLFEFDTNLADGWNVDDDPYTNLEGLLPEERGVVSGVEAQQLTFSEAMFLHSATVVDPMTLIAQNWNVTQHDDTIDHYYAWIELRNASPFPVTFDNGTVGTMTDNGVWQIEMTVDDTNDLNNPDPTRRLTLRSDDAGLNPNAPIPGGGLFSIMTDDLADVDPVDLMTVLPSHFVVDQDYVDGTTMLPVDFTDIFNNQILPSSSLARQMDLILDWQDPLVVPNQPFTITDGILPYAQPPLAQGAFFDAVTQAVATPAGSVTNVQIVLSLRRRANPNRAVPAFGSENATYDADNPWIEVDRMILTGDGLVEWDLTLLDMMGMLIPQPSGVQVKQELVVQDVKSWERRQPLSRNQEEVYPTTLNGTEDYTMVPDADVRLNTVGADNQNSLDLMAPFASWQPHFDRDFTSAIELLAVPLFGPGGLTDGPDLNTPPVVGTGLDSAGTNSAGVRRFLRPDFPDAVAPQDGLTDNNDGDNRWYRLLGMVEAPPVINNIEKVRTPGRMNLNTFRHPAHLGGVLDDASLVVLDTANRTLDSTDIVGPEPARDWWLQFVQARDGIDDPTTPTLIERQGDTSPSPGLTGLFLPGLPGAQPFRGLQFAAHDLNSLEHTLLRGLPIDAALNVGADGLPGVGGFDDDGDTVVDNAAETGWPGTDDLQPRRLFEVGTRQDRYGLNLGGVPEGDEDNVDFYTRNRLLSRMMGNSTTRSNVFFVFIQVDYFEAIEDNNGPDGLPGQAGTDDDGDTFIDYTVGDDLQPGVAGFDDDGANGVDDLGELGFPGTDDTFDPQEIGFGDDVLAVRIGGKLADSPGLRGFFVIDRSLAFEELEASHFRPLADPSKFSIKGLTEGGFDFRSVITHRQDLN